MARRLIGLIVSSSLTAALTTGCASNSAHIASLPRPTFEGPNIAQRAYVPPPQTAVVIKPNIKVAPQPRPTNVPAAWVPLANAEPRQWTYIVIHHSATTAGGAAAFDKAHKAKKWDGLGYDFVIGNGTDTADGQVEVGYRWPIQAQGAHAYTPDERFNMHGIGICLVGNLSESQPTAKQIASLEKLVAYMADTYHIKQSNILGHKMTGKQTECPGNNMDIAKVRADVARMRRLTLAEDDTPAPGTELMETAAR